MNNKKILFAGLPLSGKTTFIAALWYYAFKSTSDKKSISINFVNGENEYMNEICNEWISYSRVSRTKINNIGNTVIMNIRSNETGEEALLEIPDFGGEIFTMHFDSREWSIEFDKLLNEINGVILFINPCEVNNHPKLLIYENEILRYFGEESFTDSTDKVEWSKNFVPHQVKLVETLQFIEYYKLKNKSLKLSIVISAWDLVAKEYGSSYAPATWVGTNLPLLFQYLNCNEDIYKVKYFGVSAQGGDYEVSKDLNELTTKEPEHRILVKEDDNVSNDIGRPILWVLE